MRKDSLERKKYKKKWFNNYRTQRRLYIIKILGKVCMWNGCKIGISEYLDIHHKYPEKKKYPKDWLKKDYPIETDLEILCNEHHKLLH